jgi:hypothetical protein
MFLNVLTACKVWSTVNVMLYSCEHMREECVLQVISSVGRTADCTFVIMIAETFFLEVLELLPEDH